MMSRRDFVASASASIVAAGGPAAAGASGASGNAAEHVRTTLDVNGMTRTIEHDPRVTLLDALRDAMSLTGTKKGCDQGTCGACTVLSGGRRILSCLTLAAMHDGERITTIEGLAGEDGFHPLQTAFIERDAFQCGYCTPGQIVSAAGLLNEGVPGDRDAIARAMSGNICRCGCYPHIVDAVLDAARR